MEEDIAALTVAIEQNNELDAFSNTIHANRLILYLFYRNSLPRF
jgi:hypothetical protein